MNCLVLFTQRLNQGLESERFQLTGQDRSDRLVLWCEVPEHLDNEVGRVLSLAMDELKLMSHLLHAERKHVRLLALVLGHAKELCE